MRHQRPSVLPQMSRDFQHALTESTKPRWRTGVSTHVYKVGQVVDVVFKHGGVGGLQSQQILIPGFQSLQFVL